MAEDWQVYIGKLRGAREFKYRATWYSFVASNVEDVEEALDQAQRHIDGECKSYIEGPQDAQYPGPIPSSTGWVFREGKAGRTALVMAAPDEGDGVTRWDVWVQIMKGEFCEEDNYRDEGGRAAAKRLQEFLEEELGNTVEWEEDEA